MSLNKPRRYQPYVPDFLSLCERNYAQLRHLLPRTGQVGDAVQIQVSAADHYLLKLQELCKFTTTIRIEQVSDPMLSWLRPQFEVRLYHDARLAEVVACQQVRQFRAVYDYPNTEMLLPDEKRQINLLLRDWLTLCRTQGLCSAVVIV
jgi:uncharacterized protein YqiB (DUF1249 family)